MPGGCVLTVKSIKVHFNWNIILGKEEQKGQEGERKEFCSTVEMLGLWPKPVFVTSYLHITGDIFPMPNTTYHLSIIYLNFSLNLYILFKSEAYF